MLLPRMRYHLARNLNIYLKYISFLGILFFRLLVRIPNIQMLYAVFYCVQGL